MLTVQIASWNLYGKEPPENLCLKKWLVRNQPPALYAIGFQELMWSESFRPRSNLELDSEQMSSTLSTWKKCNETAINSSFPEVEFSEIKRIQLDGILLLIIARKDVQDELKNVSTSIYKSFTSNETDHKGAVAISCDFKGTSYVFVNCHLTPHTERWESRNEDFREICSSMDFQVGAVGLGNDGGGSRKCVMDHEHVFVFGDLNYRIIPERMSPEDLKETVASPHWKSALAHDQLKAELKGEGVIGKFQEGEINFLPTYKYNPGTHEWDSSKKQRSPAWCDRVLYSHQNKSDLKSSLRCEQIDYLSHPEFTLSDHKPISSVFKMGN